MVVTASAIGGELLFEGEPLDNTVYSKVSPHTATGTHVLTLLQLRF
jgi:hypothetical protein